MPDSIRVVPDVTTPNDGWCESEWTHVGRCCEKTAWKLINTTNAGCAYMCDAHKERFQAQQPLARVRYERIEFHDGTKA